MMRHAKRAHLLGCGVAADSRTGLVGEVGGTNVRLAVADITAGAPAISHARSYACSEFPTFEAAVDHFLAATGLRARGFIVVAAAGPITDGTVKLTNGQWVVCEKNLMEKGFAAARLIHDCAALAYAVRHLDPDGLCAIGSRAPGMPGETVGVVVAGTGLGTAALVRDQHASVVLASEGGHIGYAPVDDREIELFSMLRQRFPRVSAERVISGPGLANIHLALAGGGANGLTPEEIARRADSDALCRRSLDLFCTTFGRFAGDVALALGTRGGMYLGGGMAGLLREEKNAAAFRQGFEDKGRFAAYVKAIPTNAIVDPYAALLGAAQMAARFERADRTPAAI